MRHFIEIPNSHTSIIVSGVLEDAEKLKEELNGEASECRIVRGMMHQLGIIAALSMSEEPEHAAEKVRQLRTLISLGLLYLLNTTTTETEDDDEQAGS